MAGVSKGTVDRVLHNRGRVSEEAAARVKKILDEIDYQPNPIARQLKQNKNYDFRVLIPDPKDDEYWIPCLEGMKDFEKNYRSLGIQTTLTFYNPKSSASFTEQALALIEGQPDALFLAPLFMEEARDISKTCHEKGIKISTFNSFINHEEVSSYIGQDLHQSGRTAGKLLDLLLGKGHIAIVHIDEYVENASHMQFKEHGFRSYFNDLAHQDYQISTIQLIPDSSVSYEEALTDHFNSKQEISGVFVTTSKAHIIAAFCKKYGKNIKIVGYDLVDPNISMLKEGVIDFLINQNPEDQLYQGLDQLANHFLFDKKLLQKTLLPVQIINSENLIGYTE